MTCMLLENVKMTTLQLLVMMQTLDLLCAILSVIVNDTSDFGHSHSLTLETMAVSNV